MSVAELVADWLAKVGIDQVFSVTGGGSMFLNQAFGNHPNLNCTYMHHEQACAMAAEGYARITGKPAVVLVTTGPGAINALNGVFGAYTDSIPMIVISGQVKRETCLSFYERTGLRQLGDQEGPIIEMASPVCKTAKMIETAKQIEDDLPEVYSVSVSGRPGPVWMDIPLDIQNSQTKAVIPPCPMESIERFIPSEDCIEKIVRRLLQSNRPLILSGTGVRLSEAEIALLEFVEKFSLPVATGWTHDVISSDHPLFVGRPGTIGTRPGNICLQNADFILVLGSRLNIRQVSYSWDTFGKDAWVVQVDIDLAELKKPTYTADLSVHADVGEFLKSLEKSLASCRLPDFSVWIEWCRKINSDFDVITEHRHPNENLINPYLAVHQIIECLDDDSVIVCGNASACIIPFQVGRIKLGQRMFSNSGAASMGYDLPAAIGASLADPDRKVVCFAGDGSLQMNIQEFQTLVALRLNIIVVIINNGGYLSIRQTHENFFQKVIGADPDTGVNFPDFIKVADAYGIPGVVLFTPKDLEGIQALFSLTGPLVIDLRVDPTQEFSPRLRSRVDDLGVFQTPELDDMYPFIPREDLERLRHEAYKIESVKT